jgi:aromatic ring-opening dioxygenase LigB subunit
MISPHPPMLVPAVGGQRIKDVENTTRSLETVSKKLRKLDPDVIIFITPHGEVSLTTVHVYSGHVFEGDFSNFGVAKHPYSGKGDTELAHKIIKEASSQGCMVAEIQESILDHGILVPFHFINAAGFKKQIVPVAVSLAPLRDLFAFGKAVRDAVKKSDKTVAIVASADMSHKSNKKFDDKLVELVKNNDVEGILNFDPALAEEAGQDALWSIAILLGAVDGLGFKSKVLSYEGPFGVGYMVAEYV